MSKFQGARALIYGGAHGIGQAIALEFAHRGARVAVSDIDEDGAEATAEQIRGSQGEAIALTCDVCDQTSVRLAAEAAETKIGPIDIVVNNVGVITNGDPQDIPLPEWRRIIDINLFSVIYSQEIWAPKMLARRRGHIVNTASFAGLYPYAANRMPYVAAKAAVLALSESMALYLHPQGVRVSCFCPGPVATGVLGAMKTWTADVAFRGPGSQFKVVTPGTAACILADGMERERVLIPTDEAVWEVIRRHAADPDAFIQAKIEEVARGELGKPSM